MKAAMMYRLSLARVAAAVMVLAGALAWSAVGQNAVEPTAVIPTLPAGILADSPLAQVIKLAQAGVDQGIIQAYVTNSTSTFNLNSDKLVYLKDAGIPSQITAAMMQQDSLLQAQMAAANPPPVIPTPIPTAPTPEPMPPLLAASPEEPAVSEVPDPPTSTVSVYYFYDSLSAYGNWVLLNGYGRCWQPGVQIYNPEWQPYGDHGYWVYTDCGWYWVSDYSWGWAAFHYGRWIRDARLGWCWCPGTVWGPAWVTWRYSDDYCGWAPLPPGTDYVDGSGLTYDGATVDDDYDFGMAPADYIFVTLQNFCGAQPYRHRVAPGQVPVIYQQTTAFHHFDHDPRHGYINHGIDPARISRVTHMEIQPLAIHETSRPVGRSKHGETVAQGTLIVNRPLFRDNHGNLVADRERNQEPMNRPVAPAQTIAFDQATSQRHQWSPPETSATPMPREDSRPTVAENNFLPPATTGSRGNQQQQPVHWVRPPSRENENPAYADSRHSEPRHDDVPHLEPTRMEPQHIAPQHFEPQHMEPQHMEPQHMEPQHVEPQHESAPPASQPAHNNPAPEPKSDNHEAQKKGPH